MTYPQGALPLEPVLTTARVEGLDASLVALMAVVWDGRAWVAVISIAAAEVLDTYEETDPRPSLCS